MSPPHILGLVAAGVGLGLLAFYVVQSDREHRQPVKVPVSPPNRPRKDKEGGDTGDASGVNVRKGDSKIHHRGDHNREKNSEKKDLEAREYLYEVRKLHELFPVATLDTCKRIFETNQGNMDKCIDFLLKHGDDLDNARDSEVLPVSKDTVAEKMPEMIQVDTTTVGVTPPAGDLKSTGKREELLSELSFLNALEQEIERKKTALREEELALQALQTRVEGLKSVDVGCSTLEQVRDSQIPTNENSAPNVADADSAHGGRIVVQDASSMVLRMPKLPISELSMSDAAVSRAISEHPDAGSTWEPTSLSSGYSEKSNDSHSQGDDADLDHRSESSWSDLGAGSIDGDEHKWS